MASELSDERYTPEHVLDVVRTFAAGPIALDPCTAPYNQTRALAHCHVDGTEADWAKLTRGLREYRVVWCNPPFSNGNLKRWTAKCADEARAEPRLDIVTLLPSDFGTVAGQRTLETCDAVCFVRGRIAFLGPDERPLPGGAKTATVLAYWGERAKTFKKVFSSLGQVIVTRA